MNKKSFLKKIIFLLLAAALCVGFSSCAGGDGKASGETVTAAVLGEDAQTEPLKLDQELADGIPDEVKDFLAAYLAAFKEGPEVSVDYVYFPSNQQSHYGYYRTSIDALVEYEILDSAKVNDDLYAFLITFTMQSTLEGEPASTAWNYVARIDGEWRILTSSTSIPEGLKDNFSEEDFVVPEEYRTVYEDGTFTFTVTDDQVLW